MMSQARPTAADRLFCSRQLFKGLSRRTSSSSEIPVVKENRRHALPCGTAGVRTARRANPWVCKYAAHRAVSHPRGSKPLESRCAFRSRFIVCASGKAVPICSAVLGGMTVVKRNVRTRSEEHTSELQSRLHLVCRLLLEKKKKRGESS